MFAIIVTEKGGDQRRHEFDKSEVTIGRVQGNDVILPKGNVSKRHARIVLKDGKFIIVDLKSTNGTYVNGRKITSPLVVKENDKIYIGDFILGVEEIGAPATVEAAGGDWPGAEPARPAPPPPRRARPSAPPPPPPMPADPVPEPLPARTTAPRPAQKPPPALADEPRRPPPPRVPRPSAPPPPIAADDDALGDVPAPPPAAPPEPVAAAEPEPEPAPPPAAAQAAPAPVARAPSRPPHKRLVGAGARRKAARVAAAGRGVQLEPLDPKVVKMLELQAEIYDRVAAKLDLESLSPDELADEDLWARAEAAIVEIVESLDAAGEIPNFIDHDALIKESLNEALGLGPLEDLLAADDVDEILVDRPDRVIVGKDGVLRGSGRAFSSEGILRKVVERLVATGGGVIDDAHPLADLRLRDGTRLTAAIPPVAVRSACLAIRKPRDSGHTLAALVDAGTLSPAMADFLDTCVAARRNILVCGAPDAGKSAVVAALAAAAPEGERVVSVEEVAELDLGRDNWIPLEARPGDANGVPDVDVATVLRSALRMRPDRLVVADVRGTEALELVQAMASSNDGAIASITGEGPAALSRLAAMARLTAPGVSHDGLRELVAAAVDVVVHVARYADGTSRIAAIYEVAGATADGFDTVELFAYRNGEFVASGTIPAFYAELEARGIPADTAIFQ